jgi:sulfoxide reductase heme-binding subunit YedZ
MWYQLFGVVHFIWLVKKDLTEPLIYLAITMLLLAFRVDYKKISLKSQIIYQSL